MKNKTIQTVDQKPLDVEVMDIDSTINQDKLVVTQSNPLATSVQKMTLQEKRLLLLAMSYIRQNDNEFLLYRIPITEIQEYLELDNTVSYDRIKEISKKLLTRLVEIKHENGRWKAFQWLSYCEYIPKEESDNGVACLEIRFHDHLRPFLLQLKKHFGTLRLLQLAAMPSFNSIRICELLFHACQNFTKTTLDFSVDDLKKRLDLSGKYNNFKDFRRDILERAQRDCAEYSSLVFRWTEKKKGRKVIALHFKARRNPVFKNGSASPALEETSSSSPTTTDIPTTRVLPTTAVALGPEETKALALLKENGVNPTTASKLAKEFPPSRIIDNLKLAQNKYKKDKVKNLAATIVSAIREDWSNQPATPFEQIEQEKQHNLKAKEKRLAQEANKIDDLKQQFENERAERIKQIMDGWGTEIPQDEIDAFIKQADEYTRHQYHQYGMERKSVQAALRNYVRQKYLTPEERNFKKWAKARGYEING